MRRIILIPIMVVIIAASVLGGAAWWLTRQFAPVANEGDAVPLTIPAGASVKTIAEQLDEQSLIRSPLAFRLYVWSERVSGDLQAGEYLLSPTNSMPEIVRALTEGEALGRERTIRILEGWSNTEIGRSLEQEFGLFSAAAWAEVASATDSRTVVPDRSYTFLSDKPAAATLEGYLYPDTYRVFRDAAPADVIQKMLDNFDTRVTQQIRDEIAAQGKTLFEVLTLASIIEREVQSDADMRMVADVFQKRLRDGIALQSDATVNYVTGKNELQPTFDDLAVASPYNTYQHRGLPPGPIGNPSVAAIRAVLSPTPNAYYYFLTAPTGATIYSKTLEEHNANKAKYLK